VKAIVVALSLSLLGVTGVARAMDFSQAEALYEKRGEGDKVASITAARNALESVLPRLSPVQKLAAVTHLNRLDFYEGLLITDTDKKKVLFQACIDRSLIFPQTSPDYYYWRAGCKGLWAEANGIISSLRLSGEVESLLLQGRAIDPRFDGGGFDRMLAFVYLLVPIINPFGPTRDVNKALASAEAAIASPAYSGEADPSSATGDYFYNAYSIRGRALAALDRKDEAIATVREAISRIEQGDLPVGREPETFEFLKELKKTLADLMK
jgi:hypothetical protein